MVSSASVGKYNDVLRSVIKEITRSVNSLIQYDIVLGIISK